MVLKKDMSFLCCAEARPYLVLAVIDESIPHLCITFILKHLHMIEPVLYMITVHFDRRCIEEASAEALVHRCRDKVIKGSKLSVAVDSEISVRMLCVIKNLELAAD